MNQTVLQIAAIIIPLIVAIVFHEVSHGLAARALGDPTAQEQGRLSLNPLRHVDPFGTLVLPAILWLTTHSAFGWAKPVPVVAHRLNHPRRDMMLVAAAGPASNLVLAVVGAVLLGLLLRSYGDVQPPQGMIAFLATNLVNFIQINVFVAFFNLLPIPPFDGSHIVEGILPRQAARRYAGMRRYGFPLMFLLLLVLPAINPDWSVIDRFVIPPVQWILSHYDRLVGAVAG